MKILESKLGDTLETLSRRAYGVESNVRQILSANPGLSDPITVGTRLLIPNLQSLPIAIPQILLASGSQDVVLNLNGSRFRNWTNMTLKMAIDKPPTLQIAAPFEPDNSRFRDIFKPFSFIDTDVHVGGPRLFTGTMLSPSTDVTPTGSVVQVSAYGRTGVLTDCTASAGAFPLEFNQQDLKIIAETLLEPFGIPVVFDAPPGEVFKKVALDPGKNITPFLAGLAKQRNLVIGETPEGAMLFLQSNEGGSPVATLSENEPPVTALAVSFNPQGFFSHITGIAPTTSGAQGPQVTLANPHAGAFLRPMTFQADDSGGESLTELVDAKMGRMFANMVSWNITMPTWNSASGALWTPNQTINLIAPHAMIYRETEFLIRGVTMNITPDSRTADLNLVLPGAFAGVVPKALPWDA